MMKKIFEMMVNAGACVDRFEDTWPSDKVYLALSREVPTVGEICHCSKIVYTNGQTMLIDWYTSTVKDVIHMGNNIYQILTCNSVYVVAVS